MSQYQKEYQAKYRAENRERLAAYRKEHKKKPYRLWTEEQKHKWREYRKRQYDAKKSDPEFMEKLRANNRKYRKIKRLARDAKFLKKKSQEACARAKRKRKTDPEWVKKQLIRQAAWRKKTQPKYDCEALAKIRYHEKSKGLNPSEDLVQAIFALQKLNRTITGRLKNEK